MTIEQGNNVTSLNKPYSVLFDQDMNRYNNQRHIHIHTRCVTGLHVDETCINTYLNKHVL